MRIVPQAMTDAWKSEDKTGQNAPCVRATVQAVRMRNYAYDQQRVAGGAQMAHRTGSVRSLLFGQPAAVRELPNITSISWTRSIDQDVAEATLSLENTELIPMGQQPPAGVDPDTTFDLPGALSPWRGETTDNPWGYGSLGWEGQILPDRMVKTYEGYGCDPDVAPGLDPNLRQSGTWLIDSVELGADGKITLSMRDVGRMLLDHIVFPPNVPGTHYPMSWAKITTHTRKGLEVSGGSWQRVRGHASSSNQYYADAQIDSDLARYQDTYAGHPADLVLTNDDRYWLSSGQARPDTRVWWEVSLASPISLAGVTVSTTGGPYQAWISLQDADGKWLGRRSIGQPHETAGKVDLHEHIPFVYQRMLNYDMDTIVNLPRPYANIKKIRITLTRLKWQGVSRRFGFATALRRIKVYRGPYKDLRVRKVPISYQLGDITDYTQIAKWMCAWAGFAWPGHDTGNDYWQLDADTRQTLTFANPDPDIPGGYALWGDFQMSGTVNEAELAPDEVDKQPFMDVIGQVRDTLGYISFIDETGGFVFRLPNTWTKGNWVSPEDREARGRASRSSDIIEIAEDEMLLDYAVTLSGADLREEVFVADSTGGVGTVRRGYTPIDTNFGRTAGWVDQHFANNDECTIAADLVVTQQMFGYRTGQVVIPGYPAIQIDDQIRLHERTTAETYYHYVRSIANSLDTTTGEWTYTLTTNWLGEDDNDSWVMRPEKLDKRTAAYLFYVMPTGPKG